MSFISSAQASIASHILAQYKVHIAGGSDGRYPGSSMSNTRAVAHDAVRSKLDEISEIWSFDLISRAYTARIHPNQCQALHVTFGYRDEKVTGCVIEAKKHKTAKALGDFNEP
jgi:hypothetical protein